MLAAVAWVGGGLFYWLVLNPVLAEVADRRTLTLAIARRFRELTATCLLVLVVSGVILTVDRLTDPRASLGYGLLLGLKVALVAFMYAVYRQLDERRQRRRWATAEALLGAGVLVFLVTVVLRLVYEAALRQAASG
ncbi:MAG: hypothetical protein K6U89_13845 [Chloroflexi bacterium]|nr:hypothetical protein [Chloroflexota bacterium]GIW09610.1 MAG: hypothetical protein KatS3mg061_0667 [Dehalococcoidia bacterium]